MKHRNVTLTKPIHCHIDLCKVMLMDQIQLNSANVLIRTLNKNLQIASILDNKNIGTNKIASFNKTDTGSWVGSNRVLIVRSIDRFVG